VASIGQDDFGAGIYRGREAPAGAVYDAVNALIDDEGQAFERGKSAFYSASNSASNLARLFAPYLPAIATSRVIADRNVLNGALNPVEVTNGIGTFLDIGSRLTSYSDFAVFTDGATAITFYAGSLKTNFYSAGGVSITQGTTTLTGVGTAWLANVDAGMILSNVAANALAVVKIVNSDTQITLTKPWESATVAGAAYFLGSVAATNAIIPLVASRSFLIAAGSGLPRLLLAIGNRVYFTEPGAIVFDPNLYHELPSNGNIIGAEGGGDSALIFTTRGVWRISNLSFDPVDDAGNIQHIVEQVNKDVVLWDDYGIAAWDTGIVVPGIEDVYLVSPDFGLRTLSEGIRPLYRSYVKAGYQPGLASVHRGHYFLPILNGTTLVDTLVCRLDRPFQTPSGRVFYPWTRWSGHAAGPAYATLIAETTRSPKLLGLNAKRVTDLSGCMEKSSASGQDADATTPTFTVDTNDFDLSPGPFPSQAGMTRVVYETTGGTPTPAMASAIGPESASYTAATLIKGGGASDGTDYSAYRVNRRAERIRLRFQNTSQVTSLILRSISLWVRQSGRQ
jgi:hypothetical protein